jgi:Protein of unknown function (DUF2384)
VPALDIGNYSRATNRRIDRAQARRRRWPGGAPLADNRDLPDRAGHLLGIHKSLRLLFPYDRDLAYRWMTQPNGRLAARPVDVIIAQAFEGLLALRRYLDFQRG